MQGKDIDSYRTSFWKLTNFYYFIEDYKIANNMVNHWLCFALELIIYCALSLS